MSRIEYQQMKPYICDKDITLINNALNRGYDVSIKRIDNGVKIIQEQAKVIGRSTFIQK